MSADRLGKRPSLSRLLRTVFLDLSLSLSRSFSLGSPRPVATAGHTLREFEQSRTELTRKDPFSAPVVFFLPLTESVNFSERLPLSRRTVKLVRFALECSVDKSAKRQWTGIRRCLLVCYFSLE